LRAAKAIHCQKVTGDRLLAPLVSFSNFHRHRISPSGAPDSP